MLYIHLSVSSEFVCRINLPIGSVSKSIDTVPASAYAITRSGDAR